MERRANTTPLAQDGSALEDKIGRWFSVAATRRQRNYKVVNDSRDKEDRQCSRFRAGTSRKRTPNSWTSLLNAVFQRRPQKSASDVARAGLRMSGVAVIPAE